MRVPLKTVVQPLSQVAVLNDVELVCFRRMVKFSITRPGTLVTKIASEEIAPLRPISAAGYTVSIRVSW